MGVGLLNRLQAIGSTLSGAFIRIVGGQRVSDGKAQSILVDDQGRIQVSGSGPAQPVTALNVISAGNSTVVPLAAGATFTGAAENVLGYAELDVNIAGSPAIAPGTFFFEFSPDGTTWDVSISSSLDGPTIIPFFLRAILPFFRVRYVNGSVPLTAFRLTVLYHRFTSVRLTRFMNQPITNLEPVEIVRSVIVAERPDGVFANVTATRSSELRTHASSSTDTRTPDATTHNNTGDLVGGVPAQVLPSPWAVAFGNALKFDGANRGSNGSNQGVDCGPAAASVSGVGVAAAFSVELLFESTRTAIEGLVDFGNVVIFLSGDTLNATVIDNASTPHTITSGVLAHGLHACALTYDGTTLRLFVDSGAPVASLALSGLSSSFAATPFMFGKTNSATRNGDPFAGVIDEVRLSVVARYTTTYDMPIAAFITDSDTLGLWHCDYVFGPVYTVARDDYDDQESLEDQNGADDVLTFTFSSQVALAVITSQGNGTVSRATAGVADVPTATKGLPCFDGAPTYLPVRASMIRVYAPTGASVSVVGLKRA